MKTAVIGYPVSHSLSPLIHNYWIEKHGLSGHYEAIEIPSEDLGSRVKELVAGGLKGFNVTLPHKQAVMKLCSKIDETAQQIGAVNTVQVSEEGALTGYNTDAFGYIESLKKGAPGFDFSGGLALVIGAGGAARAIVYALEKERVPEIWLVNRTKENAQKIADDFSSVIVRGWDERSALPANTNMIVNTTSLGMTGQPPLEIDLTNLSDKSLVSDIVYKPQQTELLLQAQSRGCRTVGGLGMLLHQARPAFEKWYGVLPDVDEELLRRIEREIS